MTSSTLKLAFATILALGLTVEVARAGRGGFGGGGVRGGMGGMGRSGTNGMPPGMNSRGGMNRGMRMSGMNGMPPGTGSRGYSPGQGSSGMNGMPPGRNSQGGMAGVRTGASTLPAEGSTGAVGRPGYGAGGGYGGGYGGYGAGAVNPYNSGWYHGGWNGNYGGYGMGYNPMLAGMGYGSTYNNPYIGTQAPVQVPQGQSAATLPVGRVPGGGTPYTTGQSINYAQPINTAAAPPAASVANDAVALFDQSRAAFKGGDYDQALALCDKALTATPNDPAMHEFRALVQFAQGRYDDSAGTLYAVLSAGPGWDWTTMLGLYPGVETYTKQLRALEANSRQNPSSAADHFLMGYHYQVQGFNDAAADQFLQAAKLQPADQLAARLAAGLSQAGKAATAAATTDASAPAADYKLAGTWTATPAQGVSITLNVQDDGRFTWKVTEKGKPHELTGKASYDNNRLKLEGDGSPPLVAKVTWSDENHFTFQAQGGGPQDPGLTFSK
jgi:hypothetical protein